MSKFREPFGRNNDSVGETARLNRTQRWLLIAGGLLLYGCFRFATSAGYIAVGREELLVRLPRLLGGVTLSFPVWWLSVGLLLLLFGLGWLLPAYRTAVCAPWRSAESGRFKPPVGLLITLALFMVTMIPSGINPGVVLYLVVSGSSFTMLLAGTYRWLRFLDVPMARVERWFLGMDRRLLMLLLFSFTLLAANAVSWFVFGHHPRISDSIAQLFQSRVFISGRLFLDSPQFPVFFDQMNIINNGQWYSQYPFLHSLLMVPFVMLGVPWLANPLLGALTVPLIYLLGRELYGERTGRMAGLMACLSPFIINMSAEFMNHASALFFCVLFLLAFFRSLRTSHGRAGGWYYPALAGIALGLVFNVRPFTALAFGVPFVAYGLYRSARAPGRYMPGFLLMVGCAAIGVGLALLYNRLTNGDHFLWGYVVNWGAAHEIGFGAGGWRLHSLEHGLTNSLYALNLTNKSLFEWPIPALLPTAVLFASGRRIRQDWLLLAGFLGLVAAIACYFYHDDLFGPRFLYEASACLVILTIRGGEELGPFLRQVCRLGIADRSVARFIRRVLPVLTVMMLVIGLPPLYRTYSRYRAVDVEVGRTVEKAGPANALVFCPDIGYDVNANALTLDGDVVYAKDYGLLNAALTVSYPDRQYYYADRDTLRPFEDIAYPRSRLKRALDEMAAYLDSTSTNGYRTLVRPFMDIPIPEAGPGMEITDLYEMSLQISTNRRELDDYLPALVCWVIGSERVLCPGRRRQVWVFSEMNELKSSSAAGYRFRLLMKTREGTGAVFEVRATDDNEH